MATSLAPTLLTPVVASGEADSEDGKLCTAPSDTNAFKGKYVLIRRGGCTFGTKAANAQRLAPSV